MRTLIVCVIAFTSLFGCAARGRELLANDNATQHVWIDCVFDRTQFYAGRYDDNELCVDLAFTSCAKQKNAYVNARAEMLSYSRATRTAELLEVAMRKDLLAISKKIIIDAQRRADAPAPIPMEIK